jgi:hypothetical protein
MNSGSKIPASQTESREMRYLESRIAKGLAELERGEGISANKVFTELKARGEKKRLKNS